MATLHSVPFGYPINWPRKCRMCIRVCVHLYHCVCVCNTVLGVNHFHSPVQCLWVLWQPGVKGATLIRHVFRIKQREWLTQPPQPRGHRRVIQYLSRNLIRDSARVEVGTTRGYCGMIWALKHLTLLNCSQVAKFWGRLRVVGSFFFIPLILVVSDQFVGF